VPRVNERDSIDAVRHRQKSAFSAGRSPCPRTQT